MLASVQLLPHKTQSIERRHPWIFSGALKKMPEDVADGQVVAVLDSRGNELAKGHFNHGSIAVRVLTFENEAIDQAFFTKRITNSVALRKLLDLFRTDNSIHQNRPQCRELPFRLCALRKPSRPKSYEGHRLSAFDYRQPFVSFAIFLTCSQW
jgi:hypothetical protein